MKHIIRTKFPVFTLAFFLIAFVFMLGAPNVYANTLPYQQFFGFRNDNGSETTATWMAATNTYVTNISQNATFRIRIGTIASSGFGGPSSFSPQLEYLLASGNSCISSGWTKITTNTSNAFALASSANFTDKSPTTRQITPANFVAGEMLQATNPADSVAIGRTFYSEHEWSIKATSNASPNTAYLFRLSDNGTAYSGGYSVCPQATTSAGVSVPTVNNFIVKLGNLFQVKLGSVFRLQ